MSYVAAPPSESASNQPPRGPLRLKSKVLIVDDERLIADTMAAILNQNGFEAEAAYDGPAAIEKAEKDCPNTLIADVVMPEMDGIEAAKKILEHCPGTRILLFSGQAATAGLLERARQQGYVFELLPKPLRPEILLQRLRR